jgi:hypothetical protein
MSDSRAQIYTLVHPLESFKDTRPIRNLFFTEHCTILGPALAAMMRPTVPGTVMWRSTPMFR